MNETGEYKVKSQNLKNLYAQAISLIRGFENVTIKQIPREQNRGADKLARLAASEHKSKTGRMAARH